MLTYSLVITLAKVNTCYQTYLVQYGNSRLTNGKVPETFNHTCKYRNKNAMFTSILHSYNVTRSKMPMSTLVNTIEINEDSQRHSVPQKVSRPRWGHYAWRLWHWHGFLCWAFEQWRWIRFHTGKKRKTVTRQKRGEPVTPTKLALASELHESQQQNAVL